MWGRWTPDKRGLIKAAVGVAAAVVKTALPLGPAVDVVLALVNFDQSVLDAWQDRLLEAIKRWAADNPELLEPLSGLRTSWEPAFLKELQTIGASSLLGSDPRTRELIEGVLARTAFAPLLPNDVGSQASWAAARRLAEDLPELLVAATPPESGLAAFLQVLRSDLDEILARLPPQPADSALCEAYLNVVIRELDHSPWTHMAGGEESSLTAIAQRLRVKARADAGYGMDAEPETGDALELAARCERTVLIGGPGAGKTWLARRIAIDAARLALDALAADADPADVEIPVFAQCAAVFASDKPVWEAVVNDALAQIGHRFGSDQLTAALRRRFLTLRGRFVVILDGLDEADHLSSGDALYRLADTAERELRIVLTSRPASWRRQLLLDQRNDRHRLADLQPLRYPEDVLGVIDEWLADLPAARDGLITRLAANPELARAVQTPLICAVHCLLAESDRGLPATGRELWNRVVTRLLDGMWHSHTYQPLAGEQRVLARQSVRELAWAGAGNDPVTGLSAWPQMIQHAFQPVLPDKVESAISHIAPASAYDPDSYELDREFLHPSIREHLVAESVAAMSTAEALKAIGPHLWYDPQWEQVLPSAIALHEDRGALLDAIIRGGDEAADLRRALDRRDGFGELSRLLGGLATETYPKMWSTEHASLIDGVCRSLRAVGHDENWLAAASRGWSGAGPSSAESTDLLAGHVPWAADISTRVTGLTLTAAERQQVMQALAGLLGAADRQQTTGDPMTRAATALDALSPPLPLRTAAVDGIVTRIRSSAEPDDAAALRILSSAPIPADLVPAVLGQLLAPEGDITFLDTPTFRFFDHLAEDLAASLDLLGADDAVRHDALEPILEHLAGITVEAETDVSHLVRAIAWLRPGPEQLARVLDVLLTQLSGSMDSRHRRLLTKNIDLLLPAAPEAGRLLLQLLSTAGPWARTEESSEILRRLASRMSDEDRCAAGDVILGRMERATGHSRLGEWAQHLQELMPPAEQRAAAVQQLMSRLLPRRGDLPGSLVTAIRDLRPTGSQRRELADALVHDIGPAYSSDGLIELCMMAGWFSPTGEARSTAAATVLDAAPSVSAAMLVHHLTKEKLGSLSLTDAERRRLVDVLIRRLPEEDAYDLARLSRIITEIGPTSEQRSQAAGALVARLRGTADQELHKVVEALSGLDAAMDWRTPATAAAVGVLAGAPLHFADYDSWAPLMPQLTVSDDDRWLIAGTLARQLDPDAPRLDLKLALLDQLRPARPEYTATIADSLIGAIASGDASGSADIARLLQTWPLTASQQDAAERALAGHITTCRPWQLSRILKVLAGFSPAGPLQLEVASQVIQRLQDGEHVLDITDSLLLCGGLSGSDQAQVLKLVLGEARREGEAGDNMMTRLLQLGFDATALAQFAHTVREESAAGKLLRALASGLRHATGRDAWEASLQQFSGSFA